jgi:hypothetical protein
MYNVGAKLQRIFRPFNKDSEDLGEIIASAAAPESAGPEQPIHTDQPPVE